MFRPATGIAPAEPQDGMEFPPVQGWTAMGFSHQLSLQALDILWSATPLGLTHQDGRPIHGFRHQIQRIPIPHNPHQRAADFQRNPCADKCGTERRDNSSQASA